MSYDRSNVPVTGTKYTAAEARQLAAYIECDDLRQDGEGRDLVAIGNGETGVLVATLFDYADRVDAQAAKVRQRVESERAEALGVVIERMGVSNGRVTELDIEMPLTQLVNVMDLCREGVRALPGHRGVVFDSSSPMLRGIGRFAITLTISHIFMRGSATP